MVTSACSVVRVSAKTKLLLQLESRRISNTLLWELVLARLPNLELLLALPVNYAAIDTFHWHPIVSSSYAIFVVTSP